MFAAVGISFTIDDRQFAAALRRSLRLCGRRDFIAPRGAAGASGTAGLSRPVVTPINTDMIVPNLPMSNRERQAEFLRRHPDYYRKRRAKERAEQEARMEARRLEMQQAAERATVVRREPLMLPAPVERIEIPGMTTAVTVADLEALRARMERELVPVPVQRATSFPVEHRRVA